MPKVQFTQTLVATFYDTRMVEAGQLVSFFGPGLAVGQPHDTNACAPGRLFEGWDDFICIHVGLRILDYSREEEAVRADHLYVRVLCGKETVWQSTGRPLLHGLDAERVHGQGIRGARFEPTDAVVEVLAQRNRDGGPWTCGRVRVQLSGVLRRRSSE